MITYTNLGYMGRLGNQMFQFASVLGMAERKKLLARFPIENCSTNRLNGPLDVTTGSNTSVKCDLLECFNIPHEYFISASNLKIRDLFRESRFDYDPLSEQIQDDTDCYGYFQTEKYFSHIEEKVKEVLSFKSKFIEEGDRKMQQNSLGKTPISVHIRRGDYTLYPDHHPTCGMDYYLNALEEFTKKGIEFTSLLIFSDDKKWCQENLPNSINFPLIVSDVNCPYTELYMITQCKYHIIANSSFSWWGSWLADSELTIAPKKWFGKMISHNTSDIYCPSWLII